MNIFYDTFYCVSLESYEMEEDVREIASRLQAIAPKLTASHEVIKSQYNMDCYGIKVRLFIIRMHVYVRVCTYTCVWVHACCL